jgi:hypothetical protein
MRTNTSRVMTQFSDLGYEAGVATYPTNQEVHAYLRLRKRMKRLPSSVRTEKVPRNKDKT